MSSNALVPEGHHHPPFRVGHNFDVHQHAARHDPRIAVVLIVFVYMHSIVGLN